MIHVEANDRTKADRFAKELLCSRYGPGPRYATSNDTSGEGKYGIMTDQDEKYKWAECVQYDFMSGAICYSTNFIADKPDEIKQMFEEEVRFFRDEQTAPEDPIFQEAKHRYTAKGSGNRKDDLLCAYAQGATQMVDMRKQTKWQLMADRHGVTI